MQSAGMVMHGGAWCENLATVCSEVGGGGGREEGKGGCVCRAGAEPCVHVCVLVSVLLSTSQDPSTAGLSRQVAQSVVVAQDREIADLKGTLRARDAEVERLREELTALHSDLRNRDVRGPGDGHPHPLLPPPPLHHHHHNLLLLSF